MNGKMGNGHGGLPVNWAKERLQALSAVQPPGSLRDKLIAGVPPTGAGKPMIRHIRPWSRGIGWGAAAAAVLVVGSVIAWLGMPWERHGRPAVDANTSLGRTYASDHNSLHLSDTNLCDINSLR